MGRLPSCLALAKRPASVGRSFLAAVGAILELMDPMDPFAGDTYPLTIVTTDGETVRAELTPVQALDARAGKAVAFTARDDDPDLPPAAA